MAMTVESVVRVSFADESRAIHLPLDLIWQDIQAHRFYVKMAKARSEICRLLKQPLTGKGKGRKMQFTSIIETLIKLRDDKVMAIVEVFENKDVKIDLAIDGPRRRKIRVVDGKRMVAMCPQTPEVLDILPW